MAVQERVLQGAIKVMMLFTPVVFKVSLPGLPLPDFPLSPMYAPGPRSRALGTGPGAKWALTDRGGRSGERGHYVRVRLRRRRGPNLGAKTDGRTDTRIRNTLTGEGTDRETDLRPGIERPKVSILTFLGPSCKIMTLICNTRHNVLLFCNLEMSFSTSKAIRTWASSSLFLGRGLGNFICLCARARTSNVNSVQAAMPALP